MTQELEILERVLDHFNRDNVTTPKELYEEVFQIVNEKVFLATNPQEQESKSAEEILVNREYVAEFKTGVQITPDDWGTVSKVMKLTDETTIKEIREWYIHQTMPYADGERREIIKLSTISITQL